MPQSPREPVRLHYNDVCVLIKFIEEVLESEDGVLLTDTENHAYQRLKEMKTAMEEYFRWREERDSLKGSERKEK